MSHFSMNFQPLLGIQFKKRMSLIYNYFLKKRFTNQLKILNNILCRKCIRNIVRIHKSHLLHHIIKILSICRKILHITLLLLYQQQNVMKKVKPQHQQQKAEFSLSLNKNLDCEEISRNFQEYEKLLKQDFLCLVFLSFPSCKCTIDKHHTSLSK